MRRRRLLETGIGVVSALVPALLSPHASPAQNKKMGTSLGLTWLGHMSFLFEDGNRRILSHPFKSIGCTAGLPFANPPADLVLVSSELWDEGFTEVLPSQVPVLRNPGAYALLGTKFQGIRMAHDRLGGKRFGFNVAWIWQQAGIRILHLGGAAAPFLPEERILMGRPDLLIVPVGGGAKAYDAVAAKEAIVSLNPKVVVPMQYRSVKADSSCDLQELDVFLALFPDTPIQKLKNNSLSLAAGKLPTEMTIMTFGSLPVKTPSPKKVTPKAKPAPAR